MNKYAIIVLATLFVGCEKVKELTKFNMEYESSVTIPSSTGIDLPFNVTTPPVTTNSESTFSANNTRADLVESVTLTEMTLTLSSPQGADFSFLSDIAIYIKADGQPESLIASLNPVNGDNLTEITLTTEDVNLKDYILADQFSLKVTTTTDETLLQDHTIDILSVFRVDAKVLGL